MIKVYVKKTSEWNWNEVREFENLEEAVNVLLSDRNEFSYFNSDPLELIISKPMSDDPFKDCDYVIELYDDWRE